ncbi:MAG: adenylate/guanylate cyclase domain-containing protein [Deltaproteobacteria bacterium]|jgi:class 3 adenylate cyclase/CHASE2 domain-containing sensor protein|nr:adenylate/guanylate cyclase domain-containing protein [Deltaproteobacteria bacterium]
MLDRLSHCLEKASPARLRISIPVGVILSLIGLVLAIPGTNLPIEGSVYDFMLERRSRSTPIEPTIPIVIIAIDDLSLNNPRQSHPEFFSPGVYSHILEALVLGGAKGVAILRNLPSNESRYYNVTEEARWFQEVGKAQKRGVEIIYGFRWLADRPIRPAPKFMEIMGYDKLGFVNLYPDRDGRIRSQRLIIKNPNPPETQGTDGANGALGGDYYALAYLAAQALDPSVTVLQDKLYVDYRGSFVKFSFADIFTKAVDGEVDFFRRHFEGALVLIGATNSVNVDAYPTPLSGYDQSTYGLELIPAVEIQANAIQTMLTHRRLRDPGLGTIWFFFLGLAFLALAPLIASRPKTSYPWPWLPTALTLAYPLAAYLAFWGFVYLPVVPGLVLLLLAQGVYWGLRLWETQQVQAASRQALDLYLDPALSVRIIEDPKILTRRGEQREVTVYFTDLVGFTSMAENMDTEKVVALLNRYYETMTEAIEERGGFVDKFVGDAVMAFWGAPNDEAKHAILACQAALRQKELLESLNQELAAEGLPALSALTGLNTGPVIAGNIGGKRHKNYTVLGDTVNLASRLVAVNKIFHTAILVSEATKLLAEKEIFFRTLDLVKVPGRQKSLKIFEVIAEKDRLDPLVAQAIGFFERALKHYWKQDFTGALTRLEAALKVRPGDLPSRLFVERCRQYIVNPPKTWSGVTVLDLRKTHVGEETAT